MERTFLMIKPDGVQRGLIGEIIKRIECKGLKIVAMKMMRVSRELAEKHYEEHRGKPFYESLVSYITSSPVVAMVLEGKNAVQVVRRMIGATDPFEASPGTIRGDFGMEIGRNVVHAADSHKSAEREISLYFSEEEILEYRRIDEEWLYE
ncbi:MAG: nucleoside-diphosphate kinase [Archaeoglobi archaeon]|nr:nucleoside-diphosphate kinase [Candidatus Mnemosynella sp.]